VIPWADWRGIPEAENSLKLQAQAPTTSLARDISWFVAWKIKKTSLILRPEA
jgi:hypothetical protein